MKKKWKKFHLTVLYLPSVVMINLISKEGDLVFKLFWRGGGGGGRAGGGGGVGCGWWCHDFVSTWKICESTPVPNVPDNYDSGHKYFGHIFMWRHTLSVQR